MNSEKYKAHLLEAPTPEELAAAIEKFSPDYHSDDTNEMTRAMLVIVGEAVTLFDAGKDREGVIELLISKGLERGCAEPFVDKAQSLFDEVVARSNTLPNNAQAGVAPWKIGASIAAAVAAIGIGYSFVRTPPPEAQGCDYSGVTLKVRKLVAGQISGMSRPKSDADRMMEAHVMADKSHTMADRINASFSKPDAVALRGIRTQSTPAENAGKDIYFSCSAAASIKLDPSSANRISQYPALDKAVQLKDEAITVLVEYSTRRSPEGAIAVDLNYQHPLIETMLRVALGTRPEEGTLSGR